MNVLCLCFTMLAINTWGAAFFKLDTMPDWANTTSVSNSC